MMTAVFALGALIFVAGAVVAAQQPPPALPPAPDGVIIEQNLSYLEPGREEKLDMYLPANRPLGARSPAVVIIHGGGWAAGDKAQAREFNIGTTLAKRGYVCVSINYSLQPGNRWPTNVYDCKNAVRFLRANSAKYRIDSENIGVIGGSAGGHLALMVGYSCDEPKLEPDSPYPGISNRVQAVVDLYGLANLLTRQKTDENGNPTGQRITSSAFMNGSPKDNPDGWKLGSPVYHISKSSPPTLIIHGSIDTTIDRDQSSELAGKLKEVGVEHQLIMLPDTGHTFDLKTWKGKPLPVDIESAVVGFFDRYLKKQQNLAKPG
jgi:acetyl esterase/lipase